MEALIPALVAAGLAEFCGRMPMLAAAHGRRAGSPVPVLAGFALAAIVNMALGVAAGVALGREIPHSAARLLVGIALVLAGTGGLVRPKPASGARTGGRFVVAAAAGALLLGFGEAAQFVAAALAAASGAPLATGIGAMIGIVAAVAPAATLGSGWPALRRVRLAIGGALIAAGAVVSLSALEIG